MSRSLKQEADKAEDVPRPGASASALSDDGRSESPTPQGATLEKAAPEQELAPPDLQIPDFRFEVCVDDIAPFEVAPNLPIRDVVRQIEAAGEGLALVIAKDGSLLNTVTDGDIRRALLAGVDLDAPVEQLLEPALERRRKAPVTAPQGTSAVRLLRLMSQFLIRHVPLVNPAGRVTGLALLSRYVRREDLPLRAVIMAGGLGTRLRPLTEATPKPMLPVGDRPLLERTIEQLGQAGIHSINITTHFQAEKIRRHFGDGSSFGAALHYSHEAEPLGTAGALRQLDTEGDEPLLVINGDILTRVNYRALLEYHQEHKADMTVCVRRYAMKVPYGVVECDGPSVTALREKPEITFFFNAGIYLVEPRVCGEIPDKLRFDMTDLIDRLIALDRRVVCFPIHEYWVDIGQLEDYERVQQDVESGKVDA